MRQEVFDVWRAFRAEFEARNERLISDYASAWEDVQSLIKAIGKDSDTLMAAEPVEASIESLESLLGQHADRLLFDPVGIYQKKRPLQRVLAAIRDYEAGLDDLFRQLPASVEISGPELLELAGREFANPLRKRWLNWRKTAFHLPLRDIVRDQVLRHSSQRSLADATLQLLLAQGALHLVAPWQMWRRYQLSHWTSAETDGHALEEERQWWHSLAGQLVTQAGRALDDCRSQTALIPRQMAISLLRSAGLVSESRRKKLIERRQALFSFWSRQQRAVQAFLDVELALTRLARESTSESVTSLHLLQIEHDQSLTELDTVIEWLGARRQDAPLDSFPPPQAHLVSAEDRVADWARRVASQTRAALPATSEFVNPRRTFVGWRYRWRQVEPAKIFLESLEQTGRAIVISGFREAEAVHRSVVREIERAREVVAFGAEEAKAEDSTGLALAEEAGQNALSLLLYQKKTVVDPRSTVEHSIVTGLGATLLETQVALEKTRLGLMAHLTRQSGGRLARELCKLGLRGMRAGIYQAFHAARRIYQQFLIKVGWVPPPPVQLKAVEQRPALASILELSLGPRELPLIYRRLFRLAPVEDPRFLVGRETEMGGLADARSRWEANEGVSVVVIGSRGSGKTSLLNCAVSRLFPDVPVVYGQFCERLTTVTQLQSFLWNLLRLPDATDLASALSEQRRVIILEEFERTFLKTINGFEALHAFIDLMGATARTNLWIVSMNEAAFQYLRMVGSIRDWFSHRINAMSVAPEALTSAILQRHNLSGFRLQFAPPPQEDPRVSRVRQFLGLEQDPQQVFFEALYQQSEGIFRSAFEHWQDCIERVEGGAVYMRQPLDPDFRPLRTELAIQDLFTLQAVLQHGSLSESELAQVLRWTLEEAQKRMRRLIALDILEPDPTCPGYRVKPQGGRFVREVLHAHNIMTGGNL